MKTQLIIIAAAMLFVCACTKPTIQPAPNPKPELSWGQVVFWQQNQNDLIDIKLSDGEKGQLATHRTTAPDCIDDNSVTFKLIEGDYTYSVTTYKGRAFNGSFTVVKDQCKSIEVVLK